MSGGICTAEDEGMRVFVCSVGRLRGLGLGKAAAEGGGLLGQAGLLV